MQLIGSKPRNGRSRSRGHSKEGSREQLVYLSDSELGNRIGNEDAFEETTVFSDSLYGDSLPSMRAQLAATQMQNRRKEGGEELVPSGRENVSLLGNDGGKRGHSDVAITKNFLEKEKEGSTHGHYNSLGGSILPSKRRAKKEIMWKW